MARPVGRRDRFPRADCGRMRVLCVRAQLGAKRQHCRDDVAATTALETALSYQLAAHPAHPPSRRELWVM
jgi:hypothetical protein